MKITLDLTRAREADKAYAFRFEDQEYIVRRDDGRVGAARFPWTAELLERLRSLRDPDIGPEFTQRVGDGLQEFVAAAGWDLDAIEDAVARGEPVLVDVRSTAAELYMLPWELLTMPGSGRNLGALPGVLLRYTWPGLDAPPLVGEPRDERGGVLVAYAEHPAMEVPHAAHVDAIARAYARVYERVGAPFDPRDVADGGDVLKNMSLESLAETLERAAAGARRRVDVLHVLCHGVRVGAGYGLALRGPGG
ncbi:MAG: hypothetical protein KC468_32650, partial [Myxococcales bacterium]|nr:hypothetical protein [Myxococcales bacterium]